MLNRNPLSLPSASPGNPHSKAGGGELQVGDCLSRNNARSACLPCCVQHLIHHFGPQFPHLLPVLNHHLSSLHQLNESIILSSLAESDFIDMEQQYPRLEELLDSYFAQPSSQAKDRTFNPNSDPKYATSFETPYELMYWSSQLKLTFLTRGDKYQASKAELKAARNLMRRAGIPAVGMATPSYPQADTIVIELVAKLENDFAYAVRYFGFHSHHNRWEDDTNAHVCLVKCIIRACDQIKSMIETEFKWIKRVIFQTESEDIMLAVNKIWDWVRDGFPTVLPDGASDNLYLILNHYIEQLEAANGGTSVLFWHVPPHYLPGANNQAWFDLSRQIGREISQEEDSCGVCTAKDQLEELKFAANGDPGSAYSGLVNKYGHLKKGETFSLSNNAGADVKIIMQVDGTVAVEKEHELVTGRKLKPKDLNAMTAGLSIGCNH